MIEYMTRRALQGPRRVSAGISLIAAFLCLLSPIGAYADDYKLGVMDKLRIRVVEWQTAEGTFRDWGAITGDYTVGPSGNLSVPFVGETAAAGKTTTEVAKTIGDQLQQKFGLLDRPDASVELAEYRPIFIAGDAQTPGQYPYGPNLTVLKAVSLAGGLRRTPDGLQGVERNFINADGNHEVYVAERNRLYAKRARLLAELQGKPQIEMPKELADVEDAQALVAEETAIMQAREKRMRLQLTAIEDLKKLLENEITSLDKKSTTQTRQADLAREELKGIGNLADRGLVVNSRVLTIEQKIADMEGKILDLDTASLRAKQDINKAVQDATNLGNDREAELAVQRQQVEADIAGLTLKIEMYRNLMSEALSKAPEAAARSAAAKGPPQATFSIVREQEGKTAEIPAEENTPVLPGDVVKVTVAGLPPTD
ncbi:polysaccharide biosynthesis/export family protein [Mesorhizobium sp. ZC-5]|nr:polysaccharide biosynthesis/export family protein [Mesorhizobium sp. ZC-5]MCV3242654.1 polysaccharide biosynthesis/export family protein [Mesorhizobium sp. ZC-5]